MVLEATADVDEGWLLGETGPSLAGLPEYMLVREGARASRRVAPLGNDDHLALCDAPAEMLASSLRAPARARARCWTPRASRGSVRRTIRSGTERQKGERQGEPLSETRAAGESFAQNAGMRGGQQNAAHAYGRHAQRAAPCLEQAAGGARAGRAHVCCGRLSTTARDGGALCAGEPLDISAGKRPLNPGAVGAPAPLTARLVAGPGRAGGRLLAAARPRRPDRHLAARRVRSRPHARTRPRARPQPLTRSRRCRRSCAASSTSLWRHSAAR